MSVILLLASLVSSKCISIKDTRACPEFKDYNLFIPDNINQTLYRDTATFDDFVLNNRIFDMGNVCPSWRSVGNESVAFSNSFACAYAASVSASCNNNNPPPVKLCVDTIDTALKVLFSRHIVPKKCNTDAFKTNFGSYIDLQLKAPKVNCVRNFGLDVERYCGFTGANAEQDAAAYCENDNSPICCDRKAPNVLSTPTPTPTPIAPKEPPAVQSTASSSMNPLVVGGIFAGVALFAILLCVCFLLNRDRLRSKPVTRNMSSKSLTAATASGYYSTPSMQSHHSPPSTPPNAPLASSPLSGGLMLGNVAMQNGSGSVMMSNGGSVMMSNGSGPVMMPNGMMVQNVVPMQNAMMVQNPQMSQNGALIANGVMMQNGAVLIPSPVMVNSSPVQNNSHNSMGNQSVMMTSELKEVIYEYEAKLFDELTLRIGDQVLIKERFNDGWAQGTNLTTQKEGTFPYGCLGNTNKVENNYLTYQKGQ